MRVARRTPLSRSRACSVGCALVLGCAANSAPPPTPHAVDVTPVPKPAPEKNAEPIPSTGVIEIQAMDAALGGTYRNMFDAEQAKPLKACHRRGQPFGWVFVQAEPDNERHLTKIELEDHGGADEDTVRCIVRQLREVTCRDCNGKFSVYVRLL